MTKIKFCGLSRPCEIAAVNRLKPAYIGFVFAPKSRRYLTPEAAADLKRLLAPGIQTVGVFVNEAPQTVAKLLEDGILDLAQLHGDEDENYLAQLRRITGKPIIQAFRISGAADIERIERSTADAVLIDSGAGTGTVFDWNAILHVEKPLFSCGRALPTMWEMPSVCSTPTQWTSVRALKPTDVKIKSKWRRLPPLSERKTDYDKSKRTLWHPRRSVHS